MGLRLGLSFAIVGFHGRSNSIRNRKFNFEYCPNHELVSGAGFRVGYCPHPVIAGLDL